MRSLTTIIVTLIAACTACTNSAEPVYVDAKAIDVEYAAASTQLTLPNGDKFPAPTTPDRADDGNPVLYERGIGTQDAQLYWYCAWAEQALNRIDLGTALNQLANVRDMRVWKAFDDRSRATIDSHLDAASHDDMTPLAEYAALNCGQHSSAS